MLAQKFERTRCNLSGQGFALAAGRWFHSGPHRRRIGALPEAVQSYGEQRRGGFVDCRQPGQRRPGTGRERMGPEWTKSGSLERAGSGATAAAAA